jgi:hypothetical protein
MSLYLFTLSRCLGFLWEDRHGLTFSSRIVVALLMRTFLALASETHLGMHMTHASSQ